MTDITQHIIEISKNVATITQTVVHIDKKLDDVKTKQDEHDKNIIDINLWRADKEAQVTTVGRIAKAAVALGLGSWFYKFLP